MGRGGKRKESKMDFPLLSASHVWKTTKGSARKTGRQKEVTRRRSYRDYI